MAGALLLITFYIASHIYWSPTETLKKAALDRLASVTKEGRLVITRRVDLQWYLSKEEIQRVEVEAEERWKEIDRVLKELRDQLVTLRVYEAFDVSPLKEELYALENGVREGRYKDSVIQLQEKISPQFSRQARASGESNLLVKILGALNRLWLLRDQQEDALASLAVPLIDSSYIWLTPGLAFVELYLWSLFGVFTNLLVNVSQARSQKDYRPSEHFTIWSKLIYGPIVAVVLIKGIQVGFIDVGGLGLRASTQPLLGFIFGYSTRKSVMLLDRFSEAVFGKIQFFPASAKAAEVAKGREEQLEQDRQMAAPAAGLGDLKARMKEMARNALEVEVIKKEASL